MIKRIGLLVVIFTLSLAAPASAAEDGVIEGRLVNGTTGGSSVANLEITLDTHLNNAEMALTTTETDAEGHFSFDGLETEPGYSYQVIVTYQEADYYGEGLTFNEGETTKSTEVTVYDSTTSDEAIKVVMSHAIIYIDGDILRILENYVFINEADRTYIGSKEVAPGIRETLRFSLPVGASELQPGTGLLEGSIYTSQNGFVDSMPVLPGDKLVTYSYRIDYSSGAYEFSRRVNYPMASFDLLVQGEGTRVTSGQLTTEGLLEFEGIFYNHLSGVNFDPGEMLLAQLSNLSGSNEPGIVIWVTLTLAVLAAGVTFSYFIRRKRLQPVSPVESYEQRQQRLLVELAQLDDDFETGKIQEESYRRLRSVKKAQLIELTQGPEDKSGNG